jgi:hypothetical protein
LSEVPLYGSQPRTGASPPSTPELTRGNRPSEFHEFTGELTSKINSHYLSRSQWLQLPTSISRQKNQGWVRVSRVGRESTVKPCAGAWFERLGVARFCVSLGLLIALHNTRPYTLQKMVWKPTASTGASLRPSSQRNLTYRGTSLTRNSPPPQGPP